MPSQAARQELLPRIGPGVGVVDSSSRNLKPSSFASFASAIVYRRSLGSRWRVEQPQADPVVAVVLEDPQPGLRLAVVLEDDAAILGLLQEREVGADGVVGRGHGAALQGETRAYRYHPMPSQHGGSPVSLDPIHWIDEARFYQNRQSKLHRPAKAATPRGEGQVFLELLDDAQPGAITPSRRLPGMMNSMQILPKTVLRPQRRDRVRQNFWASSSSTVSIASHESGESSRRRPISAPMTSPRTRREARPRAPRSCSARRDMPMFT